MSNNIIDSLEYNIKMLESFEKKREILKSSTEELSKKVKLIEARIVDSKESKEYYGKAIDIMYQESIGALKSTINTALQYIIFDKNYEVDLILEDKRGTKTLSITLLDKDVDLEVELKDGVGNGIRTIVSFVLKMYYLINKNSNILVLDEKYSALSVEYTDKFFEFVHKMCEEKKFIIVMVTHDLRFTPYADKIYRISDGNVIELENSLTNNI